MTITVTVTVIVTILFLFPNLEIQLNYFGITQTRIRGRTGKLQE